MEKRKRRSCVHYATRIGGAVVRTACGSQVKAKRGTNDRESVTCASCRRSVSFNFDPAAWAAARKRELQVWRVK